MSECCRLPEAAPAEDDRCHRCGAKGRRVGRETMKSLLRPEALERLSDRPYFFDRTPGCPVVYFENEARSYFEKTSSRCAWASRRRRLPSRSATASPQVPASHVRAFLETAPPIPLCYCFGHTAESVREEMAATGRSTVAERIAAEVRAGNCSCEITNPSGRCCLGDVNRAIRTIQEELTAQVERG